MKTRKDDGTRSRGLMMEDEAKDLIVTEGKKNLKIGEL